ncbi:PrpF domain-containing protein [Rhodococcus sp. T2V]|uniref:2-methylaconitate cis-trans isomerase PrpF family protein n=1 Tax=Rhodococcus sp. T2V TaxID=3034164 RepID=UPI0023E121C0|nr:PrpF domain-containing protein [Rhodococcus sp. T2V]MDF3312044.1 PrpF domain-containing protein [Rhodococcus sp. T2V]
MTQRAIDAAFMRGGTSKGVFFRADDLPTAPDERDQVLLQVLGSPDPYGRQLNGLGGGLSSLSKAAIIGPPTRPDADIDYTFAQISVDRPIVEYAANCGNLSAAVGPYAVDTGLVQRPDGDTLVRIHNTNTGKIINARFTVRDGLAVVEGDCTVPGVAGSGAPIRLEFLDPGGSITAGVLPTGAATDTLTVDGQPIEVTMVDAGSPLAFVAASSLGLDGSELPDDIEATPGIMQRIDAIRRAAGVAMGLAAAPAEVPLVSPKLGIVAPPRPVATLSGTTVSANEHDIVARVESMGRIHRAIQVTGAMSVAAAAKIPGTIVAAAAGGDGHLLRVASPSGVVSVDADVTADDGEPRVNSVVLYRTARMLMRGKVFVAR